VTYVYTGPSTLAIIGITVVSAVITAATIYGLWWLEGRWLERREEGPGPIDPGVDGVMIEPADDGEEYVIRRAPRDDPPFPDGWHGDIHSPGFTPWAPSSDDVELARKLTRERFGGA
jgi:hypothetical protein